MPKITVPILLIRSLRQLVCYYQTFSVKFKLPTGGLLFVVISTRIWMTLYCHLHQCICRHFRLACLSYLNLNLSFIFISLGQPQTSILSCLSIQKLQSTTIIVSGDILSSDHLHLELNIYMSHSQNKTGPCWFTKVSWDYIDIRSFQYILDSLLMKIKIPFHSLSTSPKGNPLDLDCFLAELTHALKVASSVSLPSTRGQNRDTETWLERRWWIARYQASS